MLVPKFKLGQKVFGVTGHYDTKVVHIECETCNSTGFVKIQGKSGRFKCPSCEGRMETLYTDHVYKISYSNATIGFVRTEEYYSKKYGQSRVNYMLNETGVGSGKVWKEERLFATEKEAQEFCEKYVPSGYYDEEAIPKESV